MLGVSHPHPCKAQRWWLERGGRLCGHRGTGGDGAHSLKHGSHALENSLLAFELALSGGLDAVELDVQLSRDGVLVIHHDWTVLVHGAGHSGHVPLRVPVGHLTLAQLDALQPQSMGFAAAAGHGTLREAAWAAHASDAARARRSAPPVPAGESPSEGRTRALIKALEARCEPHANVRVLTRAAQRALDALHVDALGQQRQLQEQQLLTFDGHGFRDVGRGFPTLEAVLLNPRLPRACGVNVEVKVPTSDEVRLFGLRDVSREDLVARVVDVVRRCCAVWEGGGASGDGGGRDIDSDPRRPIIFSSFDPDACALLARAQAAYPVLFLTEGGTQARDEKDARMNSFGAAIEWARSAALDGVVTHAPPVVADVDACVGAARAAELMLFTYGSANNDPAIVREQLKGGLTPHAGLLVPAGDTTPAGARVLQRQRAAAKVAVKRGVLDYIVSLHGRRVMGGSGSVVETAALPTFSPLLMSDGTLGHDAFDRADAALAAMYCLAKEVEWATLANTTAFWVLVDARLPTARAGRRARDTHTLPHLRRALETLHTQSLVEEAALRAVPTQADCTSNGDGGGGAEDAIPPLSKSGATPRKRRQAAASAAAADEGLPLDLTADALQRLYDRLRVAYTDAVREELAGPNALLPWRLADVSGDAGAATAPSGPLGSRSLRSRKKVGLKKSLCMHV